MPARTLLQQAVPTTFGLKAAVWLDAVGSARGAPGGMAARRLARRRRGHARAARRRRSRRAAGVRGRARPRRARRPLARDADARAGARGRAGRRRGRCAKIALDVLLLAQTEVGEVRVPGGGSSTMPHKRNPVGPCSRGRVPSACTRSRRVFTGEHEHERAAGAWHAEWEPLSDLLALTGAAAFHVREALEGLEVDAERMRANLRAEATSEGGADVAPEDYLGSASAFVDARARAAARRRGAGPPLLLSPRSGRRTRCGSRTSRGWPTRFAVSATTTPGTAHAPAGPRTIEGFAQAALAAADAAGLDRFSFCGLSLGGMVGMWLAANAPERVERLVLACTAPFLPPRRAVARARRDRARARRRGRRRRRRRALVHRALRRPGAVAPAPRLDAGRGLRPRVRGARGDGPPRRPGPDRGADDRDPRRATIPS